MVDWRESGIQIIASLIGSGLVAGLITGIITEINKPHIDISVQDYDYSLNIPQGTFINTFTNTGNSPASNVRLTMYYPEYKINDTTLEYSSENVSLNFSNEYPSILSVSIPRFTNGAIITINTITNFPYSKDMGYNPPNKTAIPFSIIATYDEGSDKYNTEDKTYNIFFIYAIIAIAAFAIALKYKKISELIGNNINNNNQSKFVFQIYKDILAVKNFLLMINNQLNIFLLKNGSLVPQNLNFKF